MYKYVYMHVCIYVYVGKMVVFCLCDSATRKELTALSFSLSTMTLKRRDAATQFNCVCVYTYTIISLQYTPHTFIRNEMFTINTHDMV